jgi:hypothetical protein
MTLPNEVTHLEGRSWDHSLFSNTLEASRYVLQALKEILREAFPKQSELQVEAHIGNLFRTCTFNTAGRR